MKVDTPDVVQKATAKEILRILREQPTELSTKWGVSLTQAQMSMPTDGKGARLKVSVRPGQHSGIPNSVVIVLAGRAIEIPIEVREDFQECKPY